MSENQLAFWTTFTIILTTDAMHVNDADVHNVAGQLIVDGPGHRHPVTLIVASSDVGLAVSSPPGMPTSFCIDILAACVAHIAATVDKVNAGDR